MGRASDWGWQLYHRIPHRVVVGGLSLFRFLRNLTLPFPLLMLRIQAGEQGGPFSVIAAGQLPWAEHLPHLLFPGAPEPASLGKVPLWRLPRTLRKWAPSADLVVVRIDRISSRLLFGPDYVRVPELVDLQLEVPQNIDTLYSGNRNRNLKNDLRHVRSNRLTTEISHRESDFADFYDRFHVPFVRQRFGRFAWPHNRTLLRGFFQQGGLIWTLQNGQRLAGCVYGQQGKALDLLAIGTLDGDDSVTKRGAQVALFHALIERAQQLGCASVNLGGSRPLLTDGSLRFKRKWGAMLVQRAISNHLLLHWEQLNRFAARALPGTALLFLEHGHLSAVSVLHCESPATSKDVSRAGRFLRTPGLHNLYLCSSSGFEPDLSVPDGTHLIHLKDNGSTHLPESLTLKPFGVSSAHPLPPRGMPTAG